MGLSEAHNPNWKFFLFGTHVPYLFLAVLVAVWVGRRTCDQ